MDYKSGSYIMRGKKDWCCIKCQSVIKPDIKQFVRIREDDKISTDSAGNQYRKKIYQRWHIECALSINNLNKYEKDMLGFYFLPSNPSQEAPGLTNVPENGAEVG